MSDHMTVISVYNVQRFTNSLVWHLRKLTAIA